MKRALFLAACALASVVRADEIDDYLRSEMRQLHIPGLSLAIVRRGEVIKARGYGLANVELQVPATRRTVYEIGSVTKQFTAAAVMMLVREGKVGLDDPIAKYLDGVPDAWRAVTVRNLLTHSSGIQNYLDVPGLLEETARPGMTHQAIQTMFFQRLTLEFEPGATWSYSNTGYLLLGNIIEKVSGMPYWQFLEERIFAPLRMTATRNSAPSAVIANRAAGYEWHDGKLENRPALTENAYGAGSIVSTVDDLAKWDAELAKRGPDPGWTPFQPRGGGLAPINYGFGWFIDRYHGRRVVSHSGGTPGFSSVFVRFVDDGLTVIILTNHADRVIDHLAVAVAGMIVPKLARPARAVRDPDPARTARLEQALRGLFERKPDPSLFTMPMRLFMKTGTGKEVWPWIAADGPLTEFTLWEIDENTLRYRGKLGAATRWFSFVLDDEGRIAQIGWW